MKNGKWTAKATLTQSKSNTSACLYSGEIYVMGGHDIAPIKGCHVYNPTTNTWRTIADMPTARYDMSACEVGGKIYVIGGHNDGTYFALNEVYNPSNNTWETKQPMPTPREDLRVIAYNGLIYAFGGGNSGGYSNKLEVYNPSTNTWSGSFAQMPTPRHSFGLGIIGSKVHLLGGMTTGGAIVDLHECYDITTNTWTTLAPLPTSRRHLGVGVIDGKLYAIGGYNSQSSNSLATVEMYDPATNKWYRKAPMITARDRFGCAVYNNKIYALTGWSSTFYTSKCEEYDPTLDTTLVIKNIDISLPSQDARKKDNIDTIRLKTNEFRRMNGLAEYVWTDSDIVKGITKIKAIHWTEIQDAIKEVYTKCSGSQIGTSTNTIISNSVSKALIIKNDLPNRITHILKALKNIT